MEDHITTLKLENKNIAILRSQIENLIKEKDEQQEINEKL